jgi:DNA mismatch repair protein MutS2
LVADDLLDEIQRTRHEIKAQNDEITTLREQLEAQRDELQGRLDNIEDERRDVIHAARRNAQEELDTFFKELKKLQGELRTAGMPLDKLRALQEAADKMTGWVESPVDKDEVERVQDVDWKPRVGDTVFLDSLNSEGTIVELDEKEATVQVGNLKVRAKYRDMRKRNRSERRAAARGRQEYKRENRTLPPKIESPGMELDLRGARVEEAIEKLDRYIDAAYLSGLPFGRIIHGKGTGRLRQAIREYLTGHALVSKVTAANPSEGGAGVTVIHMVPIT